MPAPVNRNHRKYTSTTRDIFPSFFTKIMSKLNIEKKKCTFEGCNNFIPRIRANHHAKFCSRRCEGMFKYREKAKLEGRELVYRGTRRPGLYSLKRK